MQDDHFSYKKMLLTWVLRKMKKWVNDKIKDQVSKKSKNIKRDRKIETRFSTIIQNICSFIKKKTLFNWFLFNPISNSFVIIPDVLMVNIMSFNLKIFGEITWGHSLEALFNLFNNEVFSSRKSDPTETCNHLFGGQMSSIQDYSTTSSL